MTKYIALHRAVTRCRPQPPLNQLHNDCGMQAECARRLAANTHGDQTQDFSTGCTSYGWAMLCNRFVSIKAAEHYRDPRPDAKPMQRPDA